ncbi:MAG: class I SAM-dependent methyltransferase [Pseudomonadota bacterium]
MENDEYRVMHDLEKSYWWFVGKQYLVRTHLTRLNIENLQQPAILDIGAGTGIILKILERFGKAFGTELSFEAIRFLKERQLNLIVRSDANKNLPFRNESFSVITCLDVLEHLDRDSALLKEMFRVCRPGGYVLITVPSFQAFWSPHDTALHHKRRYTRSHILTYVKKLRFKVLKASYYNMILSIPIWTIRRIRSLFPQNEHPQSDFFISLPGALNRALTFLFAAEIYGLRFLNYPFGVSLLLILQKTDNTGDEDRKR